MLNRRGFLTGGSALVSTAVIWNSSANAFKLGGVFKRIATVVVQGLNFATNPAKQVAVATKHLANVVRQASPDGARALDMVNRIAEQNSTLEARLRIISAVGLSQALPIFANTGFQAEQLQAFADQSARPLQLTSSVEDEVRADPSNYVTRNAEYLADYARTFPFTRLPQSFNVSPGLVEVQRIRGSAPAGNGYYSSVLSIADILRLVSIFRV